MNAGNFAREELDGGLTVLTEAVPGVRSAAVGVWARWGTVHEPPAQMGASHLLEHMVFKGTRGRSALDIALVLERLGGSLDAYTTREHTSYQARVLDEHVDTALDVLADLVLDPLLREHDLTLEREVVLEEISTVDDTPDDLVFELHGEALWGAHPYGYRILGTRDTVSALSVQQIAQMHRRAYRRPNLIVAAAGSVRHEEVVAQVQRLFEAAPNGADPVALPEAPPHAPRTVHQRQATAQTHVVLGAPTFGHHDPRRYALLLVSNAFGGGMSSRLFQRVREELGLAYAVYSYQSFYRDAGVSGVYVGTRHEWADRATDVIREEMARLAADGIRRDELDDAKGQVKGQMVLAMESMGARVHRLAGYELYGEPFLSVDELMARVDAVTMEDAAAVAAECFDPERQVVVRLGP